VEGFRRHPGSPGVKEVLPEVKDNQSTTGAGLPRFSPSLSPSLSASVPLLCATQKACWGGGG